MPEILLPGDVGESSLPWGQVHKYGGVFIADEHMTPTGMDANELNTVRDILFGEKSREHEQRFDDAILEKIEIEHSSRQERAIDMKQRLQDLTGETYGG